MVRMGRGLPLTPHRETSVSPARACLFVASASTPVPHRYLDSSPIPHTHTHISTHTPRPVLLLSAAVLLRAAVNAHPPTLPRLMNM